VTICTQNREHYFGEITNGAMQLSEIGDMANKYWSEISQHFPFVELGVFVVMPNHIHGIININKANNEHDVETQNLRLYNPNLQTNSVPNQKIWHYVFIRNRTFGKQILLRNPRTCSVY